MKIKQCLTTLLLVSVSAISEAQCKYDKHEIDKFTGVTKIETKSEVLHRDLVCAVSFSFCKHDSSLFVTVGINLTGEIYTVYQGDKLMLICDNSTISLTSLETKIVQGFAYVDYSITKEQLEIINQFNITDMRIYLIDSYLERVIDSKKSEKIKLLSRCIKT
jgi:hypothetical protein